MKKKLTQSEEFEIMKLVLDKFLWLGVAILGFGLWKIFTSTVKDGVYYLVVGAVILILFMIFIVKEYEMTR